MLIMKCSKCDKYIESELLVELTSIQCEHCGTEVTVNNVLVSSHGFTFDRNDLLKRFFRYRKLLDEVIDEKNSLNENSGASQESRHSINQFLTILQGMMTGARDNFRCQFDTHVGVDLTYNQHQCRGSFVNLSMEGACVELAASNPIPRVAGQVPVEFSLPGNDVSFKTVGSICWVQQGKADQGGGHVVGLKFDSIDDDLKPLLWSFIAKQAESNSK